MSFRELGSRTRSSSGPQHNRSVAVEYEESQSSHHVPMKKNGSDGTACTSTGLSEGSTADEDPAVIGESGTRRRNGLGNTNDGNLSKAVARVSSCIARYQKAVADYEKMIQTNNRGFAHERKLKVLLDGANGASDDVSRKLSDLDNAMGGTIGSFGGDELARAKASHSKLSRDYQRIRSTHDGLLQRSSETARGSTGGKDFSSGSGNGNNLWSHDEPPLESSKHGSGDKAQLVMQREEEYSKQVMQSREDDIQQINQKMNKVNEIYKDLGNLVGSQQDQIDEIEDTAADADCRAANGLDQLQRANRPWFGGNQQQQEKEEAAAEKSWSDSITDSVKEMKSDMEAIGNDVAKKSKANLLAAQVIFCGAFGGGVPYGAPSD